MPYHVNALSLMAAEVVFDARAQFEPDIGRTIAEREKMYLQLQQIPKLEVFPSAQISC